MDVLFPGLNMTALNSLIWASAVLAKLAVCAVIGSGVIWGVLFIGVNMGWVVSE